MSRLFIVALIASCVSCSVVNNPTPVSEVSPPPRLDVPPEWEYQLQVGDQLAIKFFYNPSLNENVTVRPDGRISLQMVPEIFAANRTARELSSELKDMYSSELRDPEISVIVRSFSAQRIYVAGEVNSPGEITLLGPLTVLQAVARAEGFKTTARIAEVIVIRRKPDRTPLVITSRIKDAINGTDVSQDIELMPYDVVFVPRSIIANVNKWVDEYIRQNLPVSFGFRLDLVF